MEQQQVNTEINKEWNMEEFVYNGQTARNGFEEKITPKKDLIPEQIIKEFIRIKQVATHKPTYPTANPTTAITGNMALDVKISSNKCRNSKDNYEENRNEINMDSVEPYSNINVTSMSSSNKHVLMQF